MFGVNQVFQALQLRQAQARQAFQAVQLQHAQLQAQLQAQIIQQPNNQQLHDLQGQLQDQLQALVLQHIQLQAQIQARINQLPLGNQAQIGFGGVPAGQANAPIVGGFGPPVLPFAYLDKQKRANESDDFNVEGNTLKINSNIDLSNYEISGHINKIVLSKGKIKGKEYLPDNIKHFINTNLKFDVNGLSPNIETLEIKNDKNNKIYKYKLDNLPNKLVRLNIDTGYDLPIDNLPNSLKYLTIKDKFNQIVDNLPDSLEYLNLGDDFNQPINNLPSSLKVLFLGKKFNQPINNLPVGLKKLQIDNICDYPIQNLPNLEFFEFHYNKDLTIELPQTLKTLIGHHTERDFLKILKVNCPNLKKLYISDYKININDNNYFNDIPYGIEELILIPMLQKNNDENDEENNNEENDEKILIKNYHKLEDFVIDFTLLPSSLKKLTFTDKIYRFNCIYKFPNNITHLTLINTSDIKFSDLPDSLTYLKINSEHSEYEFYIDKLPSELELLILEVDKISNLSEIKYIYPNLKIISKNDY